MRKDENVATKQQIQTLKASDHLKRKPMTWSVLLKVRLISIIFFLVLRVIHATLRYKKVGAEHRQKADPTGKGPIALAAWHQNTILSLTAHGKDRFCVMISSSVDGEMIAKVTNWFGMATARGSSSIGGKAALGEMVDRAHNGGRVAFTVDGPKGPAKEVKNGIITLAAQTGVPILPSLPIADRYWRLSKTWDQFRIPKPFAKVRVIYGPPLFVPKDGDVKEYRGLLKAALDDLDRQALS